MPGFQRGCSKPPWCRTLQVTYLYRIPLWKFLTFHRTRFEPSWGRHFPHKMDRCPSKMGRSPYLLPKRRPPKHSLNPLRGTPLRVVSIFSLIMGRYLAPSPTWAEWGNPALQCLRKRPLTRKSYSKLFWLTVRAPLHHPGSRPLPRKLWSVKSGI